MNKTSFLRQLFFCVFSITAAVIILLAFYASFNLKSAGRAQAASDFILMAKTARPHIASAILASDKARLGMICDSFMAAGIYLTVVMPEGNPGCDTLGEKVSMQGGFSEQPEIFSAARRNDGVSTRHSEVMKKDFLYVAVPVDDAGAVRGVIRLAIPLEDVSEIYHAAFFRILSGAVFLVFLSGFLCWLVLRKILMPVEELRKGAESFASGDLTNRLYIPASYEMGELAESMNAMASQLDDRIIMASNQKSELEAVLASMIEGVVAINLDECVISMNHSAEKIFSMEQDRIRGQKIHELTRNISLLKYVDAAVESDTRTECDIILTRTVNRILHARSTPLLNLSNERIGTLFVFNDVTKLRSLENMRKDFAANVSHEIKTPLTSIRGFIETLYSCIREDPDKIQHFLEIIEKNVVRLMAIIEDLLRLSKIEDDGDHGLIKLEPYDVRDVLETAVASCSAKVLEKKIPVNIKCQDGLVADMEPRLMEQAVQNLVANAISYSNEGAAVEVSAEYADGYVKIMVRDNGIGIPYAHLDRIFERFYRVDRARSRKAGGTGLGLAIVKHITHAHAGRVEVSSRPGRGSTFTIIFPAVKLTHS